MNAHRPRQTFTIGRRATRDWMFPLRMLRVRAGQRAGSGTSCQGSSQSSLGALPPQDWAGASGGRRPGTGGVLWGCSTQNCSGDGKTLSRPARTMGMGRHTEESRVLVPPAAGHTGGTRGSDDGGRWAEWGQWRGRAGAGDEEMPAGTSSAGVAIRGPAAGAVGGPTSCRILLKRVHAAVCRCGRVGIGQDGACDFSGVFCDLRPEDDGETSR